MTETHINVYFADVEDARARLAAAQSELDAAEARLEAKKEEIDFNAEAADAGVAPESEQAPASQSAVVAANNPVTPAPAFPQDAEHANDEVDEVTDPEERDDNKSDDSEVDHDEASNDVVESDSNEPVRSDTAEQTALPDEQAEVTEPNADYNGGQVPATDEQTDGVTQPDTTVSADDSDSASSDEEPAINSRVNE